MTDAPGRGHTARYTPSNVHSDPDGRLYSEVFPRNMPPVLVALAPWLAGRTGAVLEIGCGTGQHAAALALAFPALDWWPSDPDAGHRDSALAWQRAVRAPERPPLALDAAQDWAGAAGVAALGPLSAVLAMNVLHISPPAVTSGLISGAARSLAPHGLLILYGPFRERGRAMGPGNAAFDAGLRAENPEWGLRDLEAVRDLGEAAGLSLAALIAMPANNWLVILRRDRV